jgi:rhamnogalacturonyl hydrolase YesR
MTPSRKLAVTLGLVLAGCSHTGVKPAAATSAPAPAAASANPAKAAAATAGELTDAQIREVLSRVARHNLRVLEEGEYPKADTVAAALEAKAPNVTWNYPWGVTLYGMIRSTDVTGDKDVESFVMQHDLITARYYKWMASTLESLAEVPDAKEMVQPASTGSASAKPTTRLSEFTSKAKVRGLIRLGNLDSCGAMGTQLAEVMLRHPEQVTPEQKEVAARVAEWVVNKQERLPDGTFWRPSSMDGTVWIDDLYMGGVFLTRWYKLTGERQHIDDAARQVINMAARVQDTDGVWYHGYFENEKKRSPIKWGRGNGWAMLSTVEVLSAMPADHPDRAKLIDILKRHIDGIKPLQAPSGLWRQVLDKPELWEETSSTAMFAYSIARAVNRGWIDASYMPMAKKAFAGLSTQVTADGSVEGTCQGTNIGMDVDYYLKRERPSNDLHGIGVLLLAGTEILDHGPAAKKTASR